MGPLVLPAHSLTHLDSNGLRGIGGGLSLVVPWGGEWLAGWPWSGEVWVGGWLQEGGGEGRGEGSGDVDGVWKGWG